LLEGIQECSVLGVITGYKDALKVYSPTRYNNKKKPSVIGRFFSLPYVSWTSSTVGLTNSLIVNPSFWMK